MVKKKYIYMPVNAGDAETQVQLLGKEDPLIVGKGSSLQHSCLENSMDKEVWQVTVHGFSRSRTQMND